MNNEATPEPEFCDDPNCGCPKPASTADVEMCDGPFCKGENAHPVGQPESEKSAWEDLAANAGQREASETPLNALADEALKLLGKAGFGGLVEDLRRAQAEQRAHMELMDPVAEGLAAAVQTCNASLEGDQLIEWALARTHCGCTIPLLRVGDEWAQTREQFVDRVTSEQVRQIVESLATLGKDLLGVMQELKAEGR